MSLIEPTPADIEAFRRINAMSDAELRALVDDDDDPPMLVDAIERAIALRHAADRTSR